MSDSNARDACGLRKPYEKPEVVLLRVRSAGDNVLGACKQNGGDPGFTSTNACDLCGTTGS